MTETSGNQTNQESASLSPPSVHQKLSQVQLRLAELQEACEQHQRLLQMPDSALLAGIERWYSAAEAAQFFGRTVNWLYDRFRKQKFRHSDGSPIQPIFTHTDGKRPWMRFNLPLLLEILKCCYREGWIKWEELLVIRRRIALAETGEALPDPDDI